MTRRHDPRRARAHRSYTSAEVAALFQVGVSTVRRWTQDRLMPIKGTYPYLFAGADVATFVGQRNKPRQPTGPGELYCVACKVVIRPRGSAVTVVPVNESTSNLRGTCPRCGRLCFQRVRLGSIGEKAGDLEVRYEDDEATISGNGDAPHSACLEGANA